MWKTFKSRHYNQSKRNNVTIYSYACMKEALDHNSNVPVKLADFFLNEYLFKKLRGKNSLSAEELILPLKTLCHSVG